MNSPEALFGSSEAVRWSSTARSSLVAIRSPIRLSRSNIWPSGTGREVTGWRVAAGLPGYGSLVTDGIGRGGRLPASIGDMADV